MEVMAHSPTMHNFNVSGARSSPYLSAPSSPNRFGEYYLSAPTSPSRLSKFYSEFDYFSSTIAIADSASSSKGVIDNGDGVDDDDDGFAFFVSRESDKSSRSAEELFDGGKIKPLKPTTLSDLEGDTDELFSSPKHPLLSPNRAEGKKMIRQVFSPKTKQESQSGDPLRRGRDRTPAAVLSSSNSGRRVTRSHSPYRISPYTWDEEQQPYQQPKSTKEESTSSSNSRASLSSTPSSSSSSSKSSRKWRLRDFLLFRSASEGRGSSKDPFKTYPVLYNRKPEEARSSSDNPNSAPGSRRKGPVSAHELHYAMKKAESADLKKKTFLPYRQGILGRLAGLGSLTR